MDLFRKILNSNCYLCERPGDVICSRCFKKLENIELKSLERFSLYKYNQTASKLLIMSKYEPYYFYLLKHLIRNTQIKINYPKNSILCPIPISSLRRFERKFNQATIIAREFSKVFKIPIAEVIYRKRDSNPLFSLDRSSRKIELDSIFGLHFGYSLLLKDFPNIILVDDLITTGETMLQAEKTLSNAGFNKIFFLSLFQA